MIFLIIMFLMSAGYYYYVHVTTLLATGISSTSMLEMTHIMFLNPEALARSVLGNIFVFSGYTIAIVYLILVYYTKNTYVVRGYYSLILYRSSVKHYIISILKRSFILFMKSLLVVLGTLAVMMGIDYLRGIPLDFSNYGVLGLHYAKIILFVFVMNVMYNYLIVFFDKEIDIWIYSLAFVLLIADLWYGSSFIVSSQNPQVSFIYCLVYLLIIVIESGVFYRLIKNKN